ncbi:MAG TPA: AMMECR1 domain-containing protein [Bryobacteraceae bacterium]
MTAIAGADAREELRQILKNTAILYSTRAEPIRHRNGDVAPWAFYSWNATLTSRGLRLAGLNLLERLRSFRSTQLVSYGYTAMPLLSACVMLGEGRYTGAAIRERRKTYLSCRRIEGQFDRNRPVIVIDDSLSSGRSLHNAIQAVEEDGGEVEGAVALVHFPFRGGMEWANGAGYRTETLFNIWTDLEMAEPPRSNEDPYAAILGQGQFPEGMPPAVLARRVAEAYLRDGMVPQPPKFLDRAYDARGGTFVSIRRRRDDLRLSRDGFWWFSAEEANPSRDVVYATIDTLRSSAGSVYSAGLKDLKFAVTFCGPLEKIPPSRLDFDRYGIVVCSRILPHKKGGALPNTQYFISDIEQYRHARSRNAGVSEYEAHDLYRHTVEKHVEPGERWLPYGQPEGRESNWWKDRQLGEMILARARTLLEGATGGPELNGNLIPCRIEGLGVRVYFQGELAGYGLSLGADLDACLRAAVAEAAGEPRFKRTVNSALSSCEIVVSVLHHPEELHETSLADVAKKLRRGLDAIAVALDGKITVLLPSALTYNNWSAGEFVQAALARAGGSAEKCRFTTCQTAEWVHGRYGVFRLRFGFPVRERKAFDLEQAGLSIRRLATYIYRALGTDGLPCYAVGPVTGERVHAGTAARSLHGLLTLDAAGEFLGVQEWRAASLRGLERCLRYVRNGAVQLPERSNGGLADCVLLSASARSGTELMSSRGARELAANLARQFRPDGRISAYPKRLEFPDDQDYFPGAALWAMGEYCRATGSASPATSTHLDWYQRRFRAIPNWGMAGWQPQGWKSQFHLTHDASQADMAFACADWAVEQQLEKNGAFLEDLSPTEPSFDTGFIAEGIAAAWNIAVVVGDAERAERYERSWRRAMGFMTTLMVYPEDTFCMRMGEVAVGGVRCMLSRSDIRIDQVSHCLSALIEGAKLLRSD